MAPTDKYPAFLEIPGAAALTVVIGLLSLLPLMSLPALILLPLPAVYLLVKRDLAQALLALAIAAAALAVVSSSLLLLLLVHAGPGAVLMGLLIKNKASVAQSLNALFVLAVAVAGIEIALLYASGAVGFDSFSGEADAALQQVSRLYLNSKITAEEQQRLVQMAKQAIHLTWLLLPGTIFVWTYAAVLGTFFVARRQLGRLGYAIAGGTPFSRWILPWYSIWLAIASLALMLGGEQFSVAWADTFGKNILFVAAIIFFVQGLSVITYLFQTWKMTRIVKIALVVIILLYLPFVLPALGLIDPIADLRRLSRKTSE
ncbi:MAG: YybS family protein [Firmicutes bacterium]|nr:YybS family protein [Bacillota bacterium]